MKALASTPLAGAAIGGGKAACVARSAELSFNSAAVAGHNQKAADLENKSALPKSALPKGKYRPGRIPNEYSLFLEGEREVLAKAPIVTAFGNGMVTARLGAESRTL